MDPTHYDLVIAVGKITAKKTYYQGAIYIINKLVYTYFVFIYFINYIMF